MKNYRQLFHDNIWRLSLIFEILSNISEKIIFVKYKEIKAHFSLKLRKHVNLKNDGIIKIEISKICSLDVAFKDVRKKNLCQLFFNLYIFIFFLISDKGNYA